MVLCLSGFDFPLQAVSVAPHAKQNQHKWSYDDLRIAKVECKAAPGKAPMNSTDPRPISSEQEDVRALITALHQDRQTTKEKERRESWTKYVSLMIVILAVATAIGSLKSAAFGARVMLNQAQASDTWAFYQAKSIKQRLAEMEARATPGPAGARAAADVIRYQKEELDLMDKAKVFEQIRDAASRHGAPLGFSIASLQIAIALASVALITKRKILWGASTILGAVGIAYLFYGLFGV